MFDDVMRSFVDSVRRAAFVAGAEWRSTNPESSTDDVRRAIEITFGERWAELRRQVAQEVGALGALEIAPLPASVVEEYSDSGEEVPASLPFFSEAFLYPLIGKEDARVLLALFEELSGAVGVSWPPVEDPELEEMTNQVRAGCADAYTAGVLFAEQVPDADWVRYDQEARDRYPFGRSDSVSVSLLPHAFLNLALSDLESIPSEATNLYTKIRPRFFSAEHLVALLGEDAGTLIRDRLLRIASLINVDLEAAEHERDERELRAADELAFRRERFHARMRFRKTGHHELDRLSASERAELRKAFPYRARVLVGRQMDGSGGTMIEVPFARLSGRRVEVAFELLKSGVDIAFWFGDEVELLPAEEMPESGVADETGG